MKRDILNHLGEKIGDLDLPDETPESVWQEKLSKYAVAPIEPTQYEKDLERYSRRAEAKNRILAEMATENMSRIRAGAWTVSDVISLTQDVELTSILNDVNSLSFEIAAQKLMVVANPLITPEIKAALYEKLSRNFYL